ncbi:fatty acid cis/trans isomerase [Motilimonas sp. KMU-193]|uniref:fatty acid cis/trans isomerase n=1 Tax=Motilimonas sp. KMU-193 TaxID=3388668 RepID=UPI00396B34A9
MHNRVLFAFVITLFITGCSSFAKSHFAHLYGPSSVQERWVANASPEADLFHQQVQPLLNQRCVVCHGCYDAPCQLKLTSPEAIDRGMTKAKVFSGTRLLAAQPTRLYEDANTTAQWREMGFYPVLNEHRQDESVNLQASLIYQALALKQQHPLVDTREHADAFDFSLDRNQECSAIEDYQSFARNNPLAGMPYGLPAIQPSEMQTLTDWLKGGAKMAPVKPFSLDVLKQIEQWENWLNRDSLKSQLVSRYIFEHLYLSHLYFAELSKEAETPLFFSLVRSATPPGQAIKRISTLRPYDDPKVKRVYYRLQQERETILAKTHMPYALSDERMEQLNNLFYRTDYRVTQLPDYTPQVAANPFIAFEQLPVAARYHFMRMTAQNTIMAFIKGPVCRGQMALNVINDHFWVFFSEGDWEQSEGLSAFLAQQKDHLRIPSESASNATIISDWLSYSSAQKKYLKAKQQALEHAFAGGNHLDLNLVWDGEHTNPNAALTVFRHFDNASVVKGLVGQPPKTAWLIDYPILERIHYLLVAGFDIYGNIGHQLNTRLYMDFLRLESEFNFLALLPPEARKSERDFWYRNAGRDIRNYINSEQSQFNTPTGIVYHTQDPKLELYGLLQQHLKGALQNPYQLAQEDAPLTEVNALSQLQQNPSMAVNQLAEVTVLAVRQDSETRLYTLLKNSAYSNMSSLLRDNNNRLPAEDTLTVVRGVVGDYPNVFIQADTEQLSTLVDQLLAISSPNDYSQWLDQFGVRRSDPRFWRFSDRVLAQIYLDDPIGAGLLDYNRLENR